MVNIIIICVLAAIAGGVAWYLYRKKKSGAACVGCPYSGKCGCNCSENGKADR